MLSIPFVDDEDDYIPSGDIIARYSTSITPDLPIEEPKDSLIMGDGHINTTPETETIRDIIARSKAITPDLPIEEPDNFLSMGDEHLDTIPSVEYLVPIPRESEGLSDNESECDMPVCDEFSPIFTVFSNPLFNSNDNFSSDDESLSEEEIPKEEFKFFSNPLYDIDDEIITNE
ncbi:hypothetical protein Tco_0172128, partial [Tanacetum coccineum]